MTEGIYLFVSTSKGVDGEVDEEMDFTFESANSVRVSTATANLANGPRWSAK